jgi:hypothetical protein
MSEIFLFNGETFDKIHQVYFSQDLFKFMENRDISQNFDPPKRTSWAL